MLLRKALAQPYAAGVLVFLSACSGGGLADSVSPPLPRDTTSTTPVVQRASLTVQVAVDAQDSTIARAAGVSGAGVVVRLQRVGAGSTPTELTTGADGRITFPNLLEGSYEVTVLRTLTAAEIGRLPVDDREVSVMAGGTIAALTPPAPRTVQLDLVASRRGSLVISEMYAYLPSFGNMPYNFAHYVEFTNVADTSIHLDGMLVARSLPQQHGGFPDSQFCTDFASMRLDETGVWAVQIYRFPGQGRDYPLAPGASVVWAMDAINHGAVAPGTPDLSRAHFEEIGGPGDVDNPTAAKMVALTPASPVVPRGFPMVPGKVTVVAKPVARDTLDLVRLPIRGWRAWKIPTSSILDVVALDYTTERYTSTAAYRGGFRDCDPYVSPRHDRSLARLYDDKGTYAIRRRAIGSTAAGVPILQRTRTSARDFEIAPVPLQRSLNR